MSTKVRAFGFVAFAWLLLVSAAWSQPAGGNSPGGPAIQHVIIIVQENRSTDNLFHDPKLMAKGADIASYGVNSLGQKIKLLPIKLSADYDINHEHPSFVLQYDNGKMDGANLVRTYCGSCPTNPQFKYVLGKDVAPYFQMAEQYTFADEMFQTNQGDSFPAHQFLLSGTSAPTATSDLFDADGIVANYKHANWNMGCEGPSGELTPLIDPAGDESSWVFPCFDHPTLTDLLDNANLSWLYYTAVSKSIWTAPNAIAHIREGEDWAKVVLPQTQILVDIAQGNLPNVSWVTPTEQSSDHPWMNTGVGPSWVAAIVNAVGSSPYWSNTAIFVTWDDWGGFYDHVAPPIYDSYEYGFRVPLVIVSPYAKKAYISHVTHDFGSILHFVENNWGLPSLGYADSRADDLSDCFDFAQRNVRFHKIAAPHDADYFLNAPTLPEHSTSPENEDPDSDPD
jgi:phospholipase C